MMISAKFVYSIQARDMLRLTRSTGIVALVMAAVVLVACGGTASNATPARPKVINVTMQEFSFQPPEITLKVGQPVKLILQNRGAVLHDFSSDDAEVSVKSSAHGAEHDMSGMNNEMLKVHMAADVGQTETLEFTPNKPGTYTFFCTVAEHKEAGMTGKLVITP